MKYLMKLVFVGVVISQSLFFTTAQAATEKVGLSYDKAIEVHMMLDKKYVDAETALVTISPWLYRASRDSVAYEQRQEMNTLLLRVAQNQEQIISLLGKSIKSAGVTK